MKKALLLAVMITLINPVFARTDGGGGGKGSGNYKASQRYNNPSGGENCYYCWKDLDTKYTPSRHKYAKKS
jgi:hypothetical protein